ncbi:MAG: hypothetical protein QOG08_607 [Chloroflexota bacterium]|nr:hypothetical protein [Chloroflexota bacterium]
MTTSKAADSLHAVRFPGESTAYREARNSLLKAEIDLRRQIETVAAQRRKLPLGGAIPNDYAFEEWDAVKNTARSVRLSELFEDGKDTLVLYNFMFVPGTKGMPLEEGCPSCTSIIDAVDGAAPHVTQQINFAAVAKAPIDQFRAHAKSRGWRHTRLLSSAGNTYNHDYNAEGAGGQLPIASVFVRRDGAIHHTWSSELFFVPNDPGLDMRHVDFMWPLWSILDLTPNGRGDWHPELNYAKR